MKIDNILNTPQIGKTIKKEEKISQSQADFSQFLSKAISDKQEASKLTSLPPLEDSSALLPQQEEAVSIGYDILNMLSSLEDTLSKIVPGMDKRLGYIGDNLIEKGESMISLRDKLPENDELRSIIDEIGTLSITEGYKIKRG